MKSLAQGADLRLPLTPAFSVVLARAKLSAILRSKARFLAALRSRTRLASSLNPTSSTQCSPFSIAQWLRMAEASCVGGMRLVLIALEGQQVVAATAGDLPSNFRSAGKCVQADQTAAQVQAVEQVGQHRKLAPLRIRRALRQHQPVLDRERADQMQRRAAVPAVERA